MIWMDREALLSWYREIQRPLPWRLEPSPWSILLSEILLQQTQMERGIAYHAKLLKRFPTVQSMAKSSVDEVLHLWQGAGYYSRARRLHALALDVMELHGGVLPNDYEGLLQLPGIGPYTAAAIASIAFKQPVACVDGNIRRVMARQTNQEEPSMKQVQTFADTHLVSESPGDWNQAMMELGALVCRPRNPSCEDCPIANSCKGRLRAHELPRPRKSKKKIVELILKDFLNSTSDLIPGCSLDYGVQKWLQIWRQQIANFLVQFDITYLTEKWLYLCGNRMERTELIQMLLRYQLSIEGFSNWLACPKISHENEARQPSNEKKRMNSAGAATSIQG